MHVNPIVVSSLKVSQQDIKPKDFSKMRKIRNIYFNTA
jgi:hypothetical protein